MSKPRLFTFLLFFILFVSGLSFGLAQQELPSLVKKVKPAVVVIYTYDSNGKLLGQGSGFFVNTKGEVITNYHMLQGASRGEVKTAQGMTYFVKGVTGEDIEGDLVKIVLDSSEKSFPYLRISTNLPEQGERVIVIGNPLGLEQTVSDGIVSSVRDAPPLGKIIQITAPISPGSSGSPVVNANGEVIGVAALQFKDGQSLNFAIPADRILFLNLIKMLTLQKVWLLKELKEFKKWSISKRIQSLPQWTVGTSDKNLECGKELFRSGLTLLRKNDYAGAFPYFKEAVRKKHNYSQAHFALGLVYELLGRRKEAIDAYKEAIHYQPNYALSYYSLGELYKDIGRYEEAIGAYKEAIRIQPDYADAHWWLGIVYSEIGRYEYALMSYKEIIRIKPNKYDVHVRLGDVYSKLGRYKMAIKAYKEAIRINANAYTAHFGLGDVYSKLERYKEAIEANKDAIRILPNYAEAHYTLGMTYIILHDKASALEEYKILKTLDPALANKLFNSIYK